MVNWNCPTPSTSKGLTVHISGHSDMGDIRVVDGG
jgi:hypothetical protein